ncbi:MAG: YcaO-like family protein [Caldilineaceae bacterium]|nr:YcaO-like family protein [Caldilineaceae bacterium]
MPITTTFLNQRIELFDGMYDLDRHHQFNAVRHLYNRTIGPVTAVNLYRPELLDLSMYSCSCKHAPFGALMRDLTVKAGVADTVFIPGGGKGGTLQQAFLGALGEVAERLLAILHFQAIVGQLLFATYKQLVQQGLRALGPDELPLFAAEQYAARGFRYVPFREDTPLRWLEGTNLLTGETILVPAQIMLIYYKHHPAEAHIGYPTTGGLAFHSDRRRAILHGLYEYIERDAINLRWYCRLAPSRVELDLNDFLAAHFDIRQARMATPFIDGVKVYLNTLDIPVPVLTAIAVDKNRAARAFLGGGGAWSGRERALSQALFELGQSRTALKFYAPMGLKDIRADSTVEEMTDFFDAAVYFGYADNLPRLSWYTADRSSVPWESVPSLQFKDEEDEYRVLMRMMGSAGFTPILFDFSGACWPGVSVTKLFIPELTQACIPSTPYLGHPRFAHVPKALGLRDRTLAFADFTPDPVPFP